MEQSYSKGPRLLVVDDNENIHEDMRFTLTPGIADEYDEELESLKGELFGSLKPETKSVELPNYRIDDAWNGDEALTMVEAALLEGDPYRVVFLDVNVPPRKDGIRIAGQLWGVDPNLELVICTAYSDYTWEQISALYGHSDHLLFVRKPFDSVSIKQIALSLSTKWRHAQENRAHIESLEHEVRRRTLELERLVDRLRAEMSLRRDKEFRLARQAHYDPLTGLLNRNSFYVMAGEAVARASLNDESGLSLLFIDIDGFKSVNDRSGHSAGDRLLSDIALRIREAVSTEAYRLEAVVALMAGPVPDQAIFRLGGDEFTVLLASGDRDCVRAVAERIRTALGLPFFLRGHEVSVTSSIGASILFSDATDFGSLLKHSDAAMYKSKEFGNKVVFHDELRGTGWMDPTELAQDLSSDLNDSRFEIHYQRILGEDGLLAGMAAFARWHHDRFGLILPEDFLPVADHMNLLCELERGIIASACRQVASLTSRDHRHLFVLVHCSRITLVEPAFSAFLAQVLKESGLPPSRLNLAFDISSIHHGGEKALSAIGEIANIGIAVTIEGISHGQSISSLMRAMPAGTMLQPDMELLYHVSRKESDRLYLLNLIRQMLEHCARVLVGGIETQLQEEIIRKLPTLRQGFYYGGPVPFDSFVRELNGSWSGEVKMLESSKY